MMIRWRGGSSSSSLQSFFQQLLTNWKMVVYQMPDGTKKHIRKYTLVRQRHWMEMKPTLSLSLSLLHWGYSWTYLHTYKRAHTLTLAGLAVTNFSSSFYLLQSTDKRVLSTDLTLFSLSVSRKVYFSLIHSQQFPKNWTKRKSPLFIYEVVVVTVVKVCCKKISNRTHRFSSPFTELTKPNHTTSSSHSYSHWRR